jgi:hypothetical protein
MKKVKIVVEDECGNKLHKTAVTVPSETVSKKDAGAFMRDIAAAILSEETQSKAGKRL